MGAEGQLLMVRAVFTAEAPAHTGSIHLQIRTRNSARRTKTMAELRFGGRTGSNSVSLGSEACKSWEQISGCSDRGVEPGSLTQLTSGQSIRREQCIYMYSVSDKGGAPGG